MTEPIQLPSPQDNLQDQPNPISLDTGSVAAPISDDVIDSRTAKAHLGTAPISGMSYDDIKKALANGKEKDLRDDAAARFTYNNYQQRQMDLFKRLHAGDADIDQVNELLTKYSLERQDPDTVIEQGYAGAYFRAVGDMSDPWNRSTDMKPIIDQLNEPWQMLQRTGQSIAATREYLNTQLENNESSLKAQSGFDEFLDSAKMLFQPYTDYKLSYGTWIPGLIGTNLQKQADELLNLPLDEMRAKLNPILDKLNHDNPQLAHMFLQYMVGQSTDSERLDNIYSLLGWGDALVLSKDLLKSGKSLLFSRALQASKDLTKSIEQVPGVSPQVAQAVGQGNAEKAAVETAAERFVADIKGTIDPFKRAMEQAPTFFRRDLKAIKGDPGNMGADAANRIEENYTSAPEDLLQVIKDTAAVNRAPEITTTRIGMQRIFDEIKGAYPALANNLMNIKGPIWDPFGSSWFVGRIFGRNDGTYFRSYGEAANWAKSRDLALSGAVKQPRPALNGKTLATKTPESHYLYGAEIKKQGHGYYITDLVPIDETTPIARSMLGDTARATTPMDWTGGYIDALVGWLVRSPDESQSLDQQMARKIATYAPANYLATVRKHTQNIMAISPSSSIRGFFKRKAWKDFERVLRYAQDARDPRTGEKGYFFDSPQQLYDHYINPNNIGRAPTDHEIAAYFEFKKLVEMDRFFRTMAVVRNKQRVGVMSHTVILEGKSGLIKLPSVEGRRLPVQELPQGGDGVLFLKRDPDHTRYYPGNGIPEYFRRDANRDLAEGKAQIFEIYNTEERPFSNLPFRVRGRLNRDLNLAGAKPRYVFARRMETRPLDLNLQIPRRYGGHLVPDYPFHIAQANMQFDPFTRIWDYEGDRLAFFVKSHKLGREFAQKMNEHQRIWNEQGEEAALQYARDNLHIPAEDLHKDYKTSIHPKTKETLPPRWSLKEPFHVVPSNRKIIDLGKEALESRYTRMEGDKVLHAFRDGTRSGNLARQSVVEFTQQRDAYDLFELANRGTAANPMYHLDPASLIDPMPMLMRGLNRITHNLHMDDYKIQAIEHWLFGKNVLDPTTGQMVGAANFMKDPLTAIQHSPFHYWNNVEWKTGIDWRVKRLLEGDKYKIDMFVGTPGSFTGLMQRLEQTAVDKVYGLGGSKALEMTPTWLIGKIKDGPRAVRNVLYSTKIGFFNPRQMFLHAVTGVNTWLIDPKRALPSTAGAWLHGVTVFNRHPETIAYLDRVASQLGFQTGDWKMFHEALHASGFLKAESGSLALVDSPMSTKVIRNKWNLLMHWGTKPFQMGVNTVRTAAWYMAALEWREGNLGRSLSRNRWSAKTTPAVGAMTKDDVAVVLNRADDLAHNMSRASTSAIQKGMTSYGAQFTSFNQRMLELLAGKRMTVPEKIRLFMGYAGLYGTVGAGGLVGISSMARKLLNGYDPITGSPYIPGKNIFSTFIYEGIISTMLYEFTGHLPNVGETYGAKDLDLVDRALDGDATLLDVYGGAAYHGLINTGQALTPFYEYAKTMLSDDDERFRLTPQHFINVMKEISTVNYLDRAYLGVITGRWISRNGAYLSDTSATNAIIQNLFGTSDQSTADIYQKSKEIQDWRQMENNAMKYAAKEIQLEFQALAEKNYTQAKVFHQNAKVWMQGVPEPQRSRMLSRLYEEVNIPLKDKIDLEYYLGRSRPEELRQSGTDAWQNILQMRNK